MIATVRSAAIGATAAAALALSAVAASAASPPAPLSADRAPANLHSTRGSGHFGTWTVDRFGLPAFRYTVDQQRDPRARQPELLGQTRAQHQLGNDRIVAAASNDGDVQLWSQERLSQWANRYDPATRHYAGGFGWLRTPDGTAASTFYPDRAAGSAFRRDFGVGYARKQLRSGGLGIDDTVYAPFGDTSVLRHDITLTNPGSRARRATWFEYWDANPHDQFAHAQVGLGRPRWNARTRTLAADQVSPTEPQALSLFAAAVDAPVDGFDTDASTFFGAGTRALPAAVRADALPGTIAPAFAPKTTGHTMFAFRSPVTIPARGSVTLRYAYGLAPPATIPGLVRRVTAARDPLGASERAWSAWLPRADFGTANRWVARELAWDGYLLRSASLFDAACGAHMVTQGGYYQYALGENLGSRSWLHYLLPLVQANRSLAREILRYSARVQRRRPGDEPYGIDPGCAINELTTSNDLNFWLLLAASQYGLGARDPGFFDEKVRFADDTTPVSLWDHLRRAYEFQESLRGPHGGYLTAVGSDWSDFSATLLPLTESTLVGLQAAYAYPKLADLADLRGDRAFARRLRARAAQLRPQLAATWTGRWYNRGYDGARPVGVGLIYGEPQPWAILGGLPSPARARTLVANVRRLLTGVGAPGGPTRIGSAIVPARDDPLVTETSPPSGLPDGTPGKGFIGVPGATLEGAAGWPGGAWYDVNGWLAWALSTLDGTVPNARQRAWDEYTRNTLAAHATAYPDHWDGTISVDDVCNAWYSPQASRCGIAVIPSYSGQITEQPTWMVMNALNLAGLAATKRGYRIAPRLPLRRFSVRMPEAGVAGAPGLLRGYVHPRSPAPIELRVELPKGARRVQAWNGAHELRIRRSGRDAVLTVRADGRRRIDWAVRWATGLVRTRSQTRRSQPSRIGMGGRGQASRART